MKITVRTAPTTKAYTSGEFLFGWELEAISSGYRDLSDVLKTIDTSVGGRGDIGSDETISGMQSGEIAFEYRSEVLPATPVVLGKMFRFLNAFPSLRFRTNESCGFHVHFSFPGVTANDLRWILVGVAMAPSIFRMATEFEGFPFYDEQYASTEYLTRLKKLLLARKYEEAADILNTDKLRVFRLHPQGTLEWRGPRSFLTKNSKSINSKFVQRIHHLIRAIDDVLRAKEINGVRREDLQLTKNFGKLSDRRASQGFRGFDKSMTKEGVVAALKAAPWLAKASFENGVVSVKDGVVTWESGTWHKGVWRGDVWENGEWNDGEWMGGVWNGGVWNKGTWMGGMWKGGTWEGGDWNGGTWRGGRDASGRMRTESPDKWESQY